MVYKVIATGLKLRHEKKPNPKRNFNFKSFIWQSLVLLQPDSVRIQCAEQVSGLCRKKTLCIYTHKASYGFLFFFLLFFFKLKICIFHAAKGVFV